MSFFKAVLAATLCLGLGSCGATVIQGPEKGSYARGPVSFSASAARDWLARYRASKGLPGVALDGRLDAFAQAQANAMAAHNELSHSVGGSFSDRVRAANLYGAGENVSYGPRNVPDAMRLWQNSPGHNANLLLPRATRFGIAIAQSGGTVYWAMVVAGDPPAANGTPIFGAGPTVRVVRRPPDAGVLGGLFGN